MSKTDELTAQIAELQEELKQAEVQYSTAANNLARDLRDPELRAVARAAQTRCDDLRYDIDLLNQSMASAAEADNSEEVKARREKAVQTYHEVEELLTQRNTAGAALDTALSVFAKAVANWTSVSEATHTKYHEFLKLAAADPTRLFHKYAAPADLSRTAANAIADQLHDALYEKVDVSRVLMFNHVRRDNAIPETVARDSTHSGKSYHDWMEIAARDGGLPV